MTPAEEKEYEDRVIEAHRIATTLLAGYNTSNMDVRVFAMAISMVMASLICNVADDLDDALIGIGQSQNAMEKAVRRFYASGKKW